MLKYKLKYVSRLLTEFYDILDPRCRAILLELADWSKGAIGEDITITCLGRTEEENTAMMASQYSAHLIKIDEWVRGFDIRCKNFSDEQVDLIVEHLEKTWNQNNKFLHIVATKHGTGKHIHVNIRWMYKISK
jgi:hypothetical protein